ncbi:MAG: hypothetical protein HY040_16100 [Planctomycetes bacterium]|nr:hypothetical protein [Planctomycetota bacterium]
MSVVTSAPNPHTNAVDYLFSQMIGGGDPPAIAGAGSVMPGPLTTPREPLALGEINPPPPIQSEADLQSAYQWLVAERRRLENYTRGQFQRLQAEHQTILGQSYFNEQKLIARFQEMARQEEYLSHQSRVLQRREQELAEREGALAQQMEHFCNVQNDLGQVVQTNETIRQDTDVQRQLLEALRSESAHLQKAKEEARTDLQAIEAALREHQEARAREQVDFTDRINQLEQRCRQLEETEKAAQRRLAELDELEAEMKLDFEEQERLLAHERREMEGLRKALNPAAVEAELRAEFEAQECELIQQRRELEALRKALKQNTKADSAVVVSPSLPVNIQPKATPVTSAPQPTPVKPQSQPAPVTAQPQPITVQVASLPKPVKAQPAVEIEFRSQKPTLRRRIAPAATRISPSLASELAADTEARDRELDRLRRETEALKSRLLVGRA